MGHCDRWRPSRWITCFALLVAAGGGRAERVEIPVDPRQEEKLLRAAGADFKAKYTPHFVVAYEAPSPLVKEFTTRLERTYQGVLHFCGRLEIDVTPPQRRLEVIFFDDRAGYERHTRKQGFFSVGTYGVYFEPTHRSVFFNVANDPTVTLLAEQIAASRDTLERIGRALSGIRDPRIAVEVQFGDGRREFVTKRQAESRIKAERKGLAKLSGQHKAYVERINRTVIQHEAAHQVLFDLGVHVREGQNPRWLVEGLACLFETPPSWGREGLGAINQYRLHDFRTALRRGGYRAKLRSRHFLQALEQGWLPDPDRLVSDPRLFERIGPDSSTNYAAAWSLTQFLYRHRPVKLGAYLGDLGGRRPGRPVGPDEELALFVRHFGPLDETFFKQWGGYTCQITARTVKTPF